jgi:glycosyltransferase involved in cell wall biosynthesis
MLTVIIITKNEESRIEACLESVKWAQEIIIVDHGSTDQTLTIAKSYGAKIFESQSDDFSVRRNLGAEKASGDWLLYIDADERVSSSLKDELFTIFEDSKYTAYAISRKNIIWGEEKSYGPFSPDWVIRLLHKGHFKKWVGKVHEYPQFEGELGYTKSSFIHLTHRNVEQVILKNLEWSKIDSKLRFDAHHPEMSGWRFLRIFVTETWNQGVVRQGFFNGSVGVIDSLMQVFFLLTSYVRLWEMQRKKSLNETYNDLDKKLIENNFTL